MCSFGFLPTISKATRITPTSSTLIDNIFTNDLSKIVVPGVIVTDLSDHLVIFTTANVENKILEKKDKERTVFDYNKIEHLKGHLIESLDDLTTQTDPELACIQIIQAYKDGIAMCSKTITCSRKNNFIKPWMTPAILCSINHKTKCL